MDVVRDILNHKKVDVHHKNKAGSTVLDIARKCELFDIASYLERHGMQSLPGHGKKRKRNRRVRRFFYW